MTTLSSDRTMISTSARQLAWFGVGTVVAAFLLWTQSLATGGPAGVLQVGHDSGLRPLIESELGEVPISSTGGHDGQIMFAMATDLSGTEVGSLLDDAGYRYRRILFPALASLFGVLDGHALLWSMFAVAAAGFGLATWAMARIGALYGMTPLAVLAVLASPGAWLAVRVLTPDALGLGLALAGLSLAIGGRRAAAAAILALAALTKDQFLVVALGLAAAAALRRDSLTALLYAVIPATPLVLWSSVVGSRFGGAFSPRGNLGLPFAGIAESAPGWGVDSTDLLFASVALGSIAAAAFAVIRSRSLEMRVVGSLWVGLAVVSSDWVWRFGNNAVRAFAILIPIAVAAWGSRPAREQGSQVEHEARRA